MSQSFKFLKFVQNPLVVKQVCTKPVQPLNNIQVRTEYSWPGYGSRYGFTNWRMKKDYMKRKILTEKHADRMRLNAIRKNTILPVELRAIADEEIKAEPRNSSIVAVVPRCAITGRARGTKKHYRISRIMYKHFADYGHLSGVTRACW